VKTFLESGEGYYLYSISPQVAKFSIVGDCPQCKTFNLIECWNLIGYGSISVVDVGIWASMIDEYVGEPIVLAIVKFDDNRYLDDYLAWYPGDPTNLFQVKSGNAYWIFSTTEFNRIPYPPKNQCN